MVPRRKQRFQRSLWGLETARVGGGRHWDACLESLKMHAQPFLFINRAEGGSERYHSLLRDAQRPPDIKLELRSNPRTRAVSGLPGWSLLE